MIVSKGTLVWIQIQLKCEFPYIVVKAKDDSIVRCTLCGSDFSIAVGGRSAITKHKDTNKHKQSHDAAASSSEINSFLKDLQAMVQMKRNLQS